MNSTGDKAELAKTKMALVVKKIKDSKHFLKSIVNGKYEEDTENVNITLSPRRIAAFKFATVKSRDVERSFERYYYYSAFR